MSDIADVLAVFEPTPTGDGTFTAGHLDEGHGVVFGGQLLAQSLSPRPGPCRTRRCCRSIACSPGAGRSTSPSQIAAEVLQSGRAFASVSVTTSQSRGVCTRRPCCCTRPDADRIRHGTQARRARARRRGSRAAARPFWDVRVVDDVDIMRPRLAGPPSCGCGAASPARPARPSR